MSDTEQQPLAERIVDTLRAHQFYRDPEGALCTCGQWRASREMDHPTFVEHQANAVGAVAQAAVILADLRPLIQEVITGLLHPEFGTEWRAPDGVIHQAVQQIQAEADALRARVRDYENAITWNVTCLNCSSLLDSGYRETARAEQAEQRLARIRDIATQWQNEPTINTNYASIGAFLINALDQPSDPEGKRPDRG